MVDDIHQYLPFLIEIDRLKLVNRQSRLKGNGRQENSAEHSWHLALFALSLGRDRSLDLFKLVRMLLIHDLVEIDAGDRPIHAAQGQVSEKAVAETAAARRIFGLLPREQADEYLALWAEFENGETAEASFARAIDRMQPLILNLLNDGGTWVENNVTEEMIAERYGVPIRAAFPDLWPDIWSLVKQHFAGVPLELTQTTS